MRRHIDNKSSSRSVPRAEWLGDCPVPGGAGTLSAGDCRGITGRAHLLPILPEPIAGGGQREALQLPRMPTALGIGEAGSRAALRAHGHFAAAARPGISPGVAARAPMLPTSRRRRCSAPHRAIDPAPSCSVEPPMLRPPAGPGRAATFRRPSRCQCRQHRRPTCPIMARSESMKVNGLETADRAPGLRWSR